MCVQWPGAIVASLFIGVKARNGSAGTIHPHVVAAICLGGLITVVPVVLAFVRPGRKSTRHLIAACQMLMSALLIHITGGRTETHFHVFGSLAFLAFYLDWMVLATAAAVTLAYHAILGFYAPALLFGTSAGSTVRLAEHVLWIVFCVCFLIIFCVQSLEGLKAAAHRENDQDLLIFHAYHDALTGLGNRLLVQKNLNAMLNRPVDKQQGFALICIDLDRFKEVNDTLGHQFGDLVLAEVSERLKALVRKEDTLVRMGGDEFSLILNECADVAVAERIAVRIIESLNRPFQSGESVARIGASVGICLFPEAAKGMEELFHHADLALYKAKNNGRNSYFVFDEAMRVETLRQMTLEHRLRTAVHEELFEINYQPIVNSQSRLLGFEALLRWHDAVLGKVAPDVFIPLAEKTGLIVALGKWVLRQACLEAAKWCTPENRHIKVSVNVSSIQLVQKDFATVVMIALKEAGLPAELLDLELTETVLVDDNGRARETLELLRRFGVSISIDDFGTGYSSLSYLRDLPIHRLKIDRSFVKDITESKEARALVEGMIEMAHNLNLSVVAEGVENHAQMEILAQAGCDEVQGFHISKAVSGKDAGTFMRQQPAASKGHQTPTEAKEQNEEPPHTLAVGVSG